jgi:A/G-specific adenine glycosylase
MENARALVRSLLGWYGASRRDLPWRGTRDPWRILLSEVMLQQTRVAVVIPYYQRFVERFPRPEDLAGAAEREFLAMWAGLGYYARARNLRKAARAIVEAGGFPRSYEGLRRLPGVGEYTAAAVASIAFNLPHAVLDGNVARVLSRLTAERGDIQSAAVRARLKETAERLLDRRRPGDFNQALMELGATVCLPKNPQCLLCPWRDHCEARREGIENELPVKLRKREPVKQTLVFYLIEKAGRVLLRRRGETEPRLAGFWELPEERDLPGVKRGRLVAEFRHSITRHDYTVMVYEAPPVKARKGWRWRRHSELEKIPLATTARKALELAGLPAGDAGLSPRPAKGN